VASQLKSKVPAERLQVACGECSVAVVRDQGLEALANGTRLRFDEIVTSIVVLNELARRAGRPEELPETRLRVDWLVTNERVLLLLALGVFRVEEETGCFFEVTVLVQTDTTIGAAVLEFAELTLVVAHIGGVALLETHGFLRTSQKTLSELSREQPTSVMQAT
jgi:hypothetical protein